MARPSHKTKEEELKYLLWRLVRNPHKMGPAELRYRIKCLRVLAKLEGLDWLDGFDENGDPVPVPVSAQKPPEPKQQTAESTQAAPVANDFTKELLGRD